MGSLLKILGVVFLVLVVGCVGLMIWSHEKGESVQEDFFEAVLSGDPSRVLGLMHPDLQDQIDAPILAAWMAAVKEHLGAFDGLASTDFSTSSNTTNGVTTVTSSGTVKFEKGTAKSNLVLTDDKITGFKVTSADLPDVWFTDLPDATLYVEKGRACLEKLLTGDFEGATALMHESLRAQLDPAKLERGMGLLADKLGPPPTITLLEKSFKADPPQELKLRYTVKGTATEVIGAIRIGFDKWKGSILGIDIPEG